MKLTPKLQHRYHHSSFLCQECNFFSHDNLTAQTLTSPCDFSQLWTTWFPQAVKFSKTFQISFHCLSRLSFCTYKFKTKAFVLSHHFLELKTDEFCRNAARIKVPKNTEMFRLLNKTGGEGAVHYYIFKEKKLT